MQTKIQRITPFLWFDTQAEEAAGFYVSIFPRSKVLGVTRYEQEAAAASGRPAGSVMTVSFQLDGQDFVCAERRTAFQVQRGGFLRGQLRVAERNRPLLGKPLARR